MRKRVEEERNSKLDENKAKQLLYNYRGPANSEPPHLNTFIENISNTTKTVKLKVPLLGLRINVVAEPDNPLDKDAMVVVMPPLHKIPTADAKRSTAARHIAGKWIGRLLASRGGQKTKSGEKLGSMCAVQKRRVHACHHKLNTLLNTLLTGADEPTEANPWPTQHMNTPGLHSTTLKARKKPAPRTPVESSSKKRAWKEKHGNFVKARTFIRDHIGKDSHTELAHPYFRMAGNQDAFRGTFDNAKRAGRPRLDEETEALEPPRANTRRSRWKGRHPGREIIKSSWSPGEVTLKPYCSCKNLCTTHLCVERERGVTQDLFQHLRGRPSEEQEQWLQSLSEGMLIAEFKKVLQERLCREVWKKTSTDREVVGRRADKHLLSLTARNILLHLSCVEDSEAARKGTTPLQKQLEDMRSAHPEQIAASAPSWEEMSAAEQDQMNKMNHLYCNLHALVGIATYAEAIAKIE
ncbi:hypothetical protein Bbelb_350970 [Branchiostoma belcheri]|nr:hypothetical protein Bbelb_350970 [Branchiostoma belcheri]